MVTSKKAEAELPRVRLIRHKDWVLAKKTSQPRRLKWRSTSLLHMRRFMRREISQVHRYEYVVSARLQMITIWYALPTGAKANADF
jgi:hypothetical protein